MRRWFSRPLNDLASCLEQLARLRRPFAGLAATAGALVLTWFVYVPIHELLHVLGCVIAGGTVTRLEIAPQYGGALLARWFSFVVSGGEYAGRLSGFETRGSDWIYLSTDVLPFLLSVFVGVPLIKLCGRRQRPVLFGVAIVIGLAPFYNLIGDYYEMGSIVTTRAVTLLMRRETVAFEGLRSDDIFKLIGQLFARPSALGLAGPVQVVMGFILSALSEVVAVILALATYTAGDRFAGLLFRKGRSAAGRPS